MMTPRSPSQESSILYKIYKNAQSFFMILKQTLINLCKSMSRKKKECLHEINRAKKIYYAWMNGELFPNCNDENC